MLWGGVDLLKVREVVTLLVISQLVWLITDWTRNLRNGRDVAYEALSTLVVVPGGMLLVLMLTNNIVRSDGIARWPVALGLTTAITLHFCPSAIRRDSVRRATRIGIIATTLAATLTVAALHHPYLLRTGAAQRRLQAERIWSLGPTIAAARHFDLLLAYADDLIAENRSSDAVTIYNRVLSIDVHNALAREKLNALINPNSTASLTEASTPTRTIVPPEKHRSSTALWVSADDISPAEILSTEAPPSTFCIVLVPVGETSVALLDRLAAELAARIKMPVCRYPISIPLPPPDRSYGLIGDRQWAPQSLAASFEKNQPPRGCFQYILITSGDLYMEGANFVYGAAGTVHGMASYARLRSATGDPATDALLIDRLAKQTLSTSIKAFGIASKVPGCVTTMCLSLREFDRKAQTPLPEIHRAYLAAINAFTAQSKRP